VGKSAITKIKLKIDHNDWLLLLEYIEYLYRNAPTEDAVQLMIVECLESIHRNMAQREIYGRKNITLTMNLPTAIIFHAYVLATLLTTGDYERELSRRWNEEIKKQIDYRLHILKYR
jgi:hypothetical protein